MPKLSKLVPAFLLLALSPTARSASPEIERLRTSMWTDRDAIRAAITHSHTSNGSLTPLGREFLNRLDTLTPSPAPDSPPSAESIAKLRALTNDALVTRGTALDFDKILFVKRHKYDSNHYYTDYINSNFMPGGNLCVLDIPAGEVTEIVTGLEGGVFGRYDLSFDATSIVFCWKKSALEGYRIYQINVDGSDLRQLTFPPPDEASLVKDYQVDRRYHHGTDDMSPCFLPDGGIAFISTRCQYGILCDAPDNFTTTVLYRMDADGSNITKLSNSSVSEAAPVVLPDGRILYTLWEYSTKAQSAPNASGPCGRTAPVPPKSTATTSPSHPPSSTAATSPATRTNSSSSAPPTAPTTPSAPSSAST